MKTLQRKEPVRAAGLKERRRKMKSAEGETPHGFRSRAVRKEELCDPKRRKSVFSPLQSVVAHGHRPGLQLPRNFKPSQPCCGLRVMRSRCGPGSCSLVIGNGSQRLIPRRSPGCSLPDPQWDFNAEGAPLRPLSIFGGILYVQQSYTPRSAPARGVSASASQARAEARLRRPLPSAERHLY